jgi:hypothetical protein
MNLQLKLWTKEYIVIQMNTYIYKNGAVTNSYRMLQL